MNKDDFEEALPGYNLKNEKNLYNMALNSKSAVSDHFMYEIFQLLLDDNKYENDYLIEFTVAEANIQMFSDQIQIFKLGIASPTIFRIDKT